MIKNKIIHMNKLHPTPVALNFTRGKEHGQDYISREYYLQFDFNSITIRPIIHYNEYQPGGPIDEDLLFHFKAGLRKYKAKHFQKLHLYLHECPYLDRIKLHEIGSAIASHFKNLRDLTLKLFFCRGLSSEALRYLLIPLSKSLKGLEILNISIGCCESLDDKGTNALRSLLLHRVTKLNKLTLNLSSICTSFVAGDAVGFEPYLLNRLHINNCNVIDQSEGNASQITSHGVDLLCKSLTQHLKPRLQQLTLALPGIYADGYAQSAVSNRSLFPGLQGLTKFNLHLKSFINDGRADDIDSIALCIGQSLHNLQYLTLDLTSLRCDTIYLDLKKLGLNIFSNLRLLKGFGFYCEDRMVRDEEIISLISEMNMHVLKLEDLALGFTDSYYITDKALQSIVSYINQSSRSLKRLTLDFKATQVSGHSIQLLSEVACQNIELLNLYLSQPILGINPHFSKLKYLAISFDNCENFTDPNFKEVFQNIFSWNLKTLQELTLGFLSAYCLVDDGLQTLWSQDWSQFTNLKSLKLEFDSVEELTNVTLQSLGLCIQKNLRNLQSLTVIFRKCSMELVGVKYFLMNISKHLVKLENLYIFIWRDRHQDYHGMMKQIHEIADVFCQDFRTLRTLRWHNLNLAYSHDDFEDRYLQIFKKLSHIPSLSIY